MKLDGYVRVSSVRGREGDSFISPQVQREQIAAWARLRDVEIAAWHEDLDQTGGKLDRPGLDAMMERVRRGETGGVAVARLDRLSRAGVADALKLVEEITERGARLAVVDLGVDPTTTFGEFATTIMLALARMERRRIAETWRTARQRSVERGRHGGNVAPFGYRLEGGRLVPDPETAPAVVEAFRLRANGVGWPQIAKTLNELASTRNGARWSSRTVTHLIRRRAYLGEARSGEFVNHDAHEPVVDLPLWEAANAVRGGAGAVKRSSGLATSLLRCAGCRLALKSDTGRSRSGETYRRYRCTAARSSSAADCPDPASITAPVVEPFLEAQLLLWLGGARRVEEPDDGDELAAAERAHADAAARLEEWVTNLTLQETLSADAFARGAAARQDALDAATADLERLRGARRVDERRELILRDEWSEMSVDERRFHLRRAISAVFVKRGHMPVEQRCVIFWDGDALPELPTRGRPWSALPLPWPDDPVLASVPSWAWRDGHPALPDELRRAWLDAMA